jgi:hypothetical protein
MDRYQIRVGGRIDPQWSDWLDGMEITVGDDEPPLTILDGRLADQAALRGVLTKLWDINLSILSVNLLDDDET